MNKNFLNLKVLFTPLKCLFSSPFSQPMDIYPNAALLISAHSPFSFQWTLLRCKVARSSGWDQAG